MCLHLGAASAEFTDDLNTQSYKPEGLILGPFFSRLRNGYKSRTMGIRVRAVPVSFSRGGETMPGQYKCGAGGRVYLF